MKLDNPTDFEQLSNLVKGFSNDTRLTLLLGIFHGYSATEIAKFLDMTRGGLQNNITKMIELDLVYRPSADDSPTYALTPIGEFFARIFDEFGHALLTAVETLSQTEAHVRQQIQDSPVAEGLSQPDEEKLVHTKKWQQADNQINEMLGLATTERVPPAAIITQFRGLASESKLTAEDFKTILEELDEEEDE